MGAEDHREGAVEDIDEETNRVCTDVDTLEYTHEALATMDLSAFDVDSASSVTYNPVEEDTHNIATKTHEPAPEHLDFYSSDSDLDIAEQNISLDASETTHTSVSCASPDPIDTNIHNKASTTSAVSTRPQDRIGSGDSVSITASNATHQTRLCGCSRTMDALHWDRFDEVSLLDSI